MIEEINEARKNRSALFIKQYENFEVDWNYIVDEINWSFKNKTIADLGETYLWKKHNGILMERMFYIQLISDFPSNNKKINELAKSFAKYVYNDKDYNYNNNSIQYFINFVPFNNEIGIQPNSPVHCDNWDVLFIQLIGEARWNIYKNKEDSTPIQSEIITPGDIIFIPKGVFHEIYAQTPRAGCSIPYTDF